MAQTLQPGASVHFTLVKGSVLTCSGHGTLSVTEAAKGPRSLSVNGAPPVGPFLVDATIDLAATDASVTFDLTAQVSGGGLDLATMNAAIAAAVSGLVNGAPGALDTLKELADAMADDAAFSTTVANALATKVSASDLSAAIAAEVAARNSAISTAIASLVASSPAALDTLNELAAALGNDANFAATMMSALAAKASLGSPTFTGTPAAPTPTAGDSTTKLATTAFATAAVAVVAPDYVFMDNFTRPDTTAGTLGVAEGDGNVRPFAATWNFVNGDSGTGSITGNRYTNVATKNSYASQTLAASGVKIRRVYAVIDWTGTITSGSSTATIIIAASTAAWINGAVHLQINPFYMELDYVGSGSSINLIAGGNGPGTYVRQSPVTVGTSLIVDAQYDDSGNYQIKAGGRTLSGNDSHIAALLGPTLLCQCIQNGTNYLARWQQVRVGTKALGA